MVEERVDVCSEPLVRQCTNTTEGDSDCATHYETSCETRSEVYSANKVYDRFRKYLCVYLRGQFN